MEANICDVNHLDADVLLPPRKRLLAGLKKQSSDVDGTSRPPPVASSSSSPPSSPSHSPCSNDYNKRLNNLLNSHSNPKLSPEEIARFSRSAALGAVKAAEAARAAAEEKAAIATKAVAAAKSALDLVASISEAATCKEINLRKNKLKKHVPVQLLYKKYQPIENCKTDEELARKLHRAINSSPRILKNSPSSDMKGNKHKKPKTMPGFEKTCIISDGNITLELNSPPSTCNGHSKVGEDVSEGSIQEVYKLKYEKSRESGRENGISETSEPKEKIWEETATSTGKKRGRVKLKKLPLSFCSYRDQATAKDGINNGSSPLTEKNTGNPTSANMFSVENPADEVMPIETTSIWKCQGFNASLCIKQNKVLQS